MAKYYPAPYCPTFRFSFQDMPPKISIILFMGQPRLKEGTPLHGEALAHLQKTL